jgi:hypothetical protein
MHIYHINSVYTLTKIHLPSNKCTVETPLTSIVAKIYVIGMCYIKSTQL